MPAIRSTSSTGIHLVVEWINSSSAHGDQLTMIDDDAIAEFSAFP
jgi:hypothetical protein